MVTLGLEFHLELSLKPALGVNKEKELSQTIDILQRMKGQESDQRPEGSVDDMNWG